ncbi:MAG TPA: CBS domain-containing protein [Gammaproteobacteria bacterium]|nr:CBS domain-containing protein [Gammaproteobacteria bacterium]
MLVTEIMTLDPACCMPETMLPKVARLMVNMDCGEIPVVDDLENRQLLGVVTDRDIVCRAIAADRNPAEVEVSEVMTAPVISVGEDADLQECYEKMVQNQIRRIPVVDSQGKIIGIVAQADIAREAGLLETAGILRNISRPVSRSSI